MEQSKYCVWCGLEHQAEDKVCTKCGKELEAEENLLLDFLVRHTKEKLKEDASDTVFDIIKNFLLSHLYSMVVTIALLITATAAVTNADPAAHIEKVDTPPKTLLHYTEGTQPADPAQTTAPETMEPETTAPVETTQQNPQEAAFVAYDGVLADYAAACAVDSDAWMQDLEGYQQKYSHLSTDNLMSFHSFPGQKLYLYYHDIDGNGVQELFVGMGTEEASAYSIAVYAFDGTQAVKICDAAFAVLADGTILLAGNSGAITQIKKLGADGATLEDQLNSTIQPGTMIFNQDYAAQGGALVPEWTYLCG